MDADLFTQRLQDSGLSRWELGDLLGVHPHDLNGGGGLLDQPVRVLIELARRLDLHPADLVAALEPVMANRRTPDGGRRSDVDLDGDALVLLTALATAGVPLGIDELAAALSWTLDRVTAGLTRAGDNPKLAGPVALRRVAPQTWTVTVRHDILTSAQRRDLVEAVHYRQSLTGEEATVLLAAYAFGNGNRYDDWRQDHLDAERALKAAGLLQSTVGPRHGGVHPDVRYSLGRRPDITAVVT